MYHGFLYPSFGGNVTLTVTNLPAGQYEVYLYSGQGNCQLSVGGHLMMGHAQLLTVGSQSNGMA